MKKLLMLVLLSSTASAQQTEPTNVDWGNQLCPYALCVNAFITKGWAEDFVEQESSCPGFWCILVKGDVHAMKIIVRAPEAHCKRHEYVWSGIPVEVDERGIVKWLSFIDYLGLQETPGCCDGHQHGRR